MERIPEILPLPFLERMKSMLSDDFQAFRAALEQETPVSIRLNPFKLKISEGYESVPWCENGFYLPERPSFTLDPLFHAGAYYVQEPSSMFLEQVFRTVAPPGNPLLVLDMCGAPGGKTTHLLSLMNRESLLVTNEVIRSRASVLVENVIKWGYPKVVVTSNDPKDFGAVGEVFDIVVLDAPCSGEGLFRKDKNAIHEWSVENANHCSARQKRILDDAWKCLKPGGFLIYSTCTFNPDENEKNLDQMALRTGAKPVEIPISLFNGIEKISTSIVTGYRFMPHLVRGEGFFTGVLQKPEGKETVIRGMRKPLFQSSGQNVIKSVEGWLLPDTGRIFLNDSNRIISFSRVWTAMLEYFSARLNSLMFGLPVAEKAGNNYNPLHNLAVSAALNRDKSESIELSLQQALSYLKRETFPVTIKDKGWILVKYKNVPLGWIKNLDNRFNNYYPAAWRIRIMIPTITSAWYDAWI